MSEIIPEHSRLDITVHNGGTYTIRHNVDRKGWSAVAESKDGEYELPAPDRLHAALAWEVEGLRRQVAAMEKPEGSFMWALNQMLWRQADIYRESEQHLEYQFDGAEGCRIWKYDSDEDDLSEHAFTCAQIIAQDWKVKA